MKKRTLGIVLLILAVAALAGGAINGSLFSAKNPFEALGYWGAFALLLCFGFKNLFTKEN